MVGIPVAGLASAEVKLGDSAASTAEETFLTSVSLQAAVLGGLHGLGPPDGVHIPIAHGRK